MKTQPGLYVELDSGDFWRRTGNRWFRQRNERWNPFKRPVGDIQRLVEPKASAFHRVTIHNTVTAEPVGHNEPFKVEVPQQATEIVKSENVESKHGIDSIS